MSNIVKNSVNQALIDIYTDKVREEKSIKTKSELITDLDILKALGDSVITQDEYNEILNMINIEFSE